MSRSAGPAPTCPPGRRRPATGVLCLWLLPSLLLASSCSKEERAPEVEPPPRIGILQPLDSAEVDPRHPRNVPAGSRLVRLDRQGPDGKLLVLTAGFAAAGEARLSHDGEELLFLGRQGPTDPLAVYACDLQGAKLRRVAPAERAEAPATRLPDGRVVFSESPGEGHSAALFIATGDGSPGRRITFSGNAESDPTLLKDGRILYVGWRQGANGSRPALFTVFPDGTGASLFHAPARDAAITSPCQAADGDIFFVAGGALRRIDWRRPRAAAQTPALPAGARALRVALGAEASLLVTTRNAAGATQVLRLTAAGTAVALTTPALGDLALVQILEAVVRPRPQGHLSRVDPTRPYGTWLGMEITVEGAETVRILARTDATSNRPPYTALGVAPLHADGSFFVRVPVDTPLRIELLDGSGHVLRASRTPYWVRPNEVRGCTGCHDPENLTPFNASPKAAAEAPIDLCPPAGAEGTR